MRPDTWRTRPRREVGLSEEAPGRRAEKKRETPIAPSRPLSTCPSPSHSFAAPLSSLSPPQEPDYIHAPSMYNIPAMTNRKLKFGLGVSAVVLGGFAVPVIAASHQQRRAAG
jgi:hypothetical protein